MQFTVTLQDLLIASGVVAPLGFGALYWAARMAIKSEVKDLKLDIMEQYMRVTTCEKIRAECERHRHETAGVLQTAGRRSHGNE